MVTVDRLTSMNVFARVARTRSFSGAARELGISQATASKHVQTLEDWLGVRLLHRTTRRVALTDVGESFFVQCSRILEDMEAARSAAKPEAPVRGNMRITAPVVFGSTRLGPLVVDFLQQHPELTTERRVVGSIGRSDRGRIRPGDTHRPHRRRSWSPGPSCRSTMCCARRPPIWRAMGRPPHPRISARITASPEPTRGGRAGGSMGLTGRPRCRSMAGCRSTTPCCAATPRGPAPASCSAPTIWWSDDFANGRLVQLLPEHRPAGRHAACGEPGISCRLAEGAQPGQPPDDAARRCRVTIGPTPGTC